jgi:hypothetical protein
MKLTALEIVDYLVIVFLLLVVVVTSFVAFGEPFLYFSQRHQIEQRPITTKNVIAEANLYGVLPLAVESDRKIMCNKFKSFGRFKYVVIDPPRPTGQTAADWDFTAGFKKEYRGLHFIAKNPVCR